MTEPKDNKATAPSCSPTSTEAPQIPDPDIDIERDASLASNGSTALPDDPFNLRTGIQTDDQLINLKRRKNGGRIVKYHNEQNNLIEYLLKPMEDHTTEAKDVEDAARLPVKIAIWASLLSNFALCVLQMYAAISSLSLSLLATGIDSVFDIGSNILLFWLHRKSSKLDSRKWPVGGARLETIGNIVYGFLMGSVNLIVAVESVRSIVAKEGDELSDFHLPAILAVSAALGVKLLLFLFSYPFRKNSSQVRVLWEDHRNDLWINTFGPYPMHIFFLHHESRILGIVMATGGSKWKWYLDPLGAIIIALGIIASWSRTVHGQFELLAGKSASHEFLQLLVYKSMTFSEDIEKIDTVRAYHSGPNYFVEVDIVMDASTSLFKAHDISQQLQDKLEQLPGVERAFVHVDHETSHAPEHRKYV